MFLLPQPQGSQAKGQAVRKPDANEPSIVAALRKAGATVIRIESPIAGVPDLVVGFRGHWYAIEVKMPKTGRVSEEQRVWHLAAAAPVAVVTSEAEAFRAVGLGG